MENSGKESCCISFHLYRKMHAIPSTRESTTQALCCRRDTELRETYTCSGSTHALCVEDSVSICPIFFPTHRNCHDCAVSSFNVNDRLMQPHRACVVDFLVLGTTCILYRCKMCTSHPDLVSSAILIFHILNLYTCLLLFLITIPNALTILVQVSSSAKKEDYTLVENKTIHSTQSATRTQMHVWELCLKTLYRLRY